MIKKLGGKKNAIIRQFQEKLGQSFTFMQEFVYDYKASDAQLAQKVTELLRDKENYIKKISNALPEVRKESYKQFEYLFKAI